MRHGLGSHARFRDLTPSWYAEGFACPACSSNLIQDNSSPRTFHIEKYGTTSKKHSNAGLRDSSQQRRRVEAKTSNTLRGSLNLAAAPGAINPTNAASGGKRLKTPHRECDSVALPGANRARLPLYESSTITLILWMIRASCRVLCGTRSEGDAGNS